MKSTLIWGLVVLNVLMAGVLIGRYTRPNVAEAQAGRPGDYTVIPVDFQGLPTGSLAVIDNASGNMSVLVTDENNKRMEGLPRVNVSQLFDAAAGRRPAPEKGR